MQRLSEENSGVIVDNLSELCSKSYSFAHAYDVSPIEGNWWEASFSWSPARIYWNANVCIHPNPQTKHIRKPLILMDMGRDALLYFSQIDTATIPSAYFYFCEGDEFYFEKNIALVKTSNKATDAEEKVMVIKFERLSS